MPNADKPKALQLPSSLMERLSLALGQWVTVYLMHVRSAPIVGSGPCPPYEPLPPGPPPPPTPGQPSPGVGTGPGFAGPPLTPGIPPGGGHVGPLPPLAWECPPGKAPAPHVGTGTVTGTLAFAGVDYLVIRIPVNQTCADILIPYNAIGMIVLHPLQ
jgi:hypothetical protein